MMKPSGMSIPWRVFFYLTGKRNRTMNVKITTTAVLSTCTLGLMLIAWHLHNKYLAAIVVLQILGILGINLIEVEEEKHKQ